MAEEKESKEVQAPKLDAKWLTGLVFKTSALHEEREGGKKDGRVISKEWRKIDRPLTVSDILDWRDNGDSVVIVAGDGRKYAVAKKAA